MILRKLMLLLILLVSVQGMAQESGTRITYGDISLNLDPSLPQNVNISRYEADPLEIAYPGGPQPARLEMVFYETMPAPEYAWYTDAAIWLYRSDEIAGYTQHEEQLQLLQSILNERPELAPFEQRSEDSSPVLPLLPVAPAVQAIRARSAYVEGCGFSGISYLTVYRQDTSPFLANDFFYTFQGISADGQYVISAMFRVLAPGFPTEFPSDFDYEAFAAQYTDYTNESVVALNATAPDDFSPSLTNLDAMIQSISIGEIACG